MFLHTTKIRKSLTIQSNFLDDPNLSLAAKGLYVQLYYSNDRITALNGLLDLVNSSEEDLKKAFDELADCGYIEISEKRCDLLPKANTKASKKPTAEEVTKYAESTQPKTLNKYEKLQKLIESYSANGFSENLISVLKVYFENWMNKKGPFVESSDLHGNVVKARIGDLIGFHLSDDEMIDVVQTSNAKVWHVFVKPTTSTTNSTEDKKSVSNFDKSSLTSGDYTEEDMNNIKKLQEELKANGEKGYF